MSIKIDNPFKDFPSLEFENPFADALEGVWPMGFETLWPDIGPLWTAEDFSLSD